MSADPGVSTAVPEHQSSFQIRLADVLTRMENVATLPNRPAPRLLAVSKTQPSEAIAMLATEGQQAFGENYVQEALPKIDALRSKIRPASTLAIGVPRVGDGLFSRSIS